MDVTSTESVDQQVKEREAANKNYWDIVLNAICPNTQYKT